MNEFRVTGTPWSHTVRITEVPLYVYVYLRVYVVYVYAYMHELQERLGSTVTQTCVPPA